MPRNSRINAVTQELPTSSSDRTDKRIHVALPVRVTYFDNDSKPRLEMACTYDISAHGARVTGLRCVKEAGEIVVVERGRSKAYCRVVWIGQANSHLQGQVGIQCVEAQKTLWTAELRDMEEMYDPMTRDSGLFRLNSTASAKKGNRRRYRRFATEGAANVLQKGSAAGHLEGGLKDVSEVGCLITTKSLILPGTDLKLVLTVSNYDLSFKGRRGTRRSMSAWGLSSGKFARATGRCCSICCESWREKKTKPGARSRSKNRVQSLPGRCGKACGRAGHPTDRSTHWAEGEDSTSPVMLSGEAREHAPPSPP